MDDLLRTLRRVHPDGVRAIDPLGRVVDIAVPPGRTKWPGVISSLEGMRYERVELLQQSEVVAVVQGAPPVASEDGRKLAELLLITEAAADRAAQRVLDAFTPALNGMQQVLTSVLKTMEAERERADAWKAVAEASPKRADGKEDIMPLIMELVRAHRAQQNGGAYEAEAPPETKA